MLRIRGKKCSLGTGGLVMAFSNQEIVLMDL
jgi:hypothetical protein